MKRRYFCGGSVLAVVMGLGLAQPALAQDDTEVEEVVVTGSFIAGTPEDAALPVDVISSEELEKQGSPTAVQLVKTIGAAQSSIGESNRFLGSAAGAATVNLRGFGSSRTLVLFNGRRLANSPAAIAAEATDINLLPQAAIGRVEILREGAAATYGSDAVGGVVNFITRRDLDGLEIAGEYSFIDGSNGDYEISAAYGWVGERANVLFTAGYRHRSELRSVDRDWAVRPFSENPFGGWSTASNPGIFQTGTAAQLAAGTFATSFLDPGCVELGGVLVNPANPASGCRFQFSLHDNLVNDEDHYQLYGEVNFDITETLSFHAEAMWGSHDVPEERVSAAQSTTQFPTPIVASGGSPGGGTSPYPAVGLNQQSRFYVPPTNPGLVAWVARNCPAAGATVCANVAANGAITSQTLWRPQGFGGSPLFNDADRQRRFAQAYRVSAGFKGDLPWWGMGFDTAVTYMRADGKQETPDLAVNRIQLALRGLGGEGCNPVTGVPGQGGCMWYSPFSNAYPNNPVTGAVNPAFNPAVATNPDLYRWMYQRLETETTTQLFAFDVVLNGDLAINLGGGPIAYAVGGQWRYDAVEHDRNDISNIAVTPCVDSPPFGDGLPLCTGGTGPFTFYGAQEEYDIDRIVKAVFAEVLFPVTEDLEVTAAVRYEYFGGNFGSTTNPKISARWQIFDFLAVRGSVGSTFRAPPQTSLTPGSSRGLAQFNLPADVAGGVPVGSLYRPVDTANNPDLEPETADTFNVGVVVEAGGFRGTVDFFKFKFKDELTTETAASLVNTMFPLTTPGVNRCNDAELRSRFTFADDGNPATNDCVPSKLLGVRTNLINGPDVDTSGIDFAFSYTFDDVLGGQLQVGADGTYMFEYDRGPLITIDGFEIAPRLDRAGKSELLSAFFSYPKLRSNIWVNFNWDIHNVRWTTRFKEGPINIVGASVLGTKDDWQHDLVYTGELPWDATLTLGVLNIFDTEPPFTRSQYNYDYTNANPLGRVFEIGIKKRFF